MEIPRSNIYTLGASLSDVCEYLCTARTCRSQASDFICAKTATQNNAIIDLDKETIYSKPHFLKRFQHETTRDVKCRFLFQFRNTECTCGIAVVAECPNFKCYQLSGISIAINIVGVHLELCANVIEVELLE